MALYEILDRGSSVLSTSGEAPGERRRRSPAHRAVGMAQVGMVVLLLTCWLAGGYAGIVYWSVQGSLLGVIASAGVSGAGAASVWSLFTGLDRQ